MEKAKRSTLTLCRKLTLYSSHASLLSSVLLLSVLAIQVMMHLSCFRK